MTMSSASILPPLAVALLCVAGCRPPADSGATAATTTDPTTGTAPGTAATTGTETETDTTPEPPTTSQDGTAATGAADLPSDPTDGLACERPGGCDRLDILFVIDNSESMGPKQRNLVAALPLLVEQLRDLVGRDGDKVVADVNVMVTTTDVGHPLCEIFQKPSYKAAKGAPISSACTERLERFTSVNGKVKIPELCTDTCPPDQAAHPADPFLHFAGDTHNVIAAEGVLDPVARALACIVPQGVDGCGFEAPLEAMLRALDAEAAWNTGPRPFIREGAALAIVVLTDEADCSIEDFKYFDLAFKDHPEFGQYYELDPATNEKSIPTSAICWNGAMTCDPADANGVHAACVETYKEVLWPVSRYTDRLRAPAWLREGKPVFMLVLGGVPSVTARNPEPPHEPIAGGWPDIIYRAWTDADLLPGDPDSVAVKHHHFGIGPACKAPAIGYGLPPGRLLDVCRALDLNEQAEVACCVESVCDPDFAGAVTCLTGMSSRRLSAGR